jgi:NAD(P)-dependent dehydrogenase (short-subunit alcohol dehydrogenase family)
LCASGHQAEACAFDVTDEAAIVAGFGDLDARGIEVDILVNNAGIQFRKPMLELATDDWRRVIETNLTSAFVIGREAARRMVPRGRGKIINIGSLTSFLSAPRSRPCRRQGRHAADASDDSRVGGQRHPGQCHRPRLHDHRHDPGLDRQPGLRRLGEGPDAGQTLGQAG